jgi:bidirectional [NiFe] hydrogenase diaphorase subunit
VQSGFFFFAALPPAGPQVFIFHGLTGNHGNPIFAFMAVELVIDGKKVSAEAGEYLIDVARRNRIAIPSLCHHESLTPQGSCRLCLVEIESRGRKRIATSCNFPVRGGEIVRTKTKKIRRLRGLVIELLLPLAPDSVLLRALAREYGIRKSRFAGRVQRIDCILCGLCVRVCSELAGARAIDFAARGAKKTLTTPYGLDTGECIACGACRDVCPTQAITMEDAAVRRLRLDPGPERWCRYHLMGIMPAALCPMNYDCARCDIDQSMRALCGGHPLLQRRREGKA